MPANHYGKGSVGTSMSLVCVRNGREVKKRPPRRSNCKKCIHAIVHGNCIDCYITGEVAVKKEYCNYFRTEEERYGRKSSNQYGKRNKKNGRRVNKKRKHACKKGS